MFEPVPTPITGAATSSPPCSTCPALLHVISLARLACVHTWAWAAGSLDTRTRLAAQLQQAQAQIALLQEELRIKDTRMAQIAAHRRPHYPPTERMAILELRAARGWNQVQTAKAMLVTPETVAAWNRRVDEQGPHALVQLPEPVNRFPDFVRYNEHRPHTALRGATPNERYFGLRPANRAPRFEPRPHWPRGSPCAKPQTLIMGQPGARIELTVTFEAERRHLPIVTLRRVA